ncbi:alpha-tocopherol transfer protein-like [Eurytemora carolleeae]|uniref:alpha-tocopherol transfer protein-like n=1 Tax=Eurytemora carolleeae TaxID=1294199 RepID=UPI000C762B6A|nr:alpha-tocopherol transfer protein-like [Eurytemora carolleeae]|eukprot:XP_023340745.1 alpha-tocopherol transfer protein-like [Eurytemora affinis]
MDKQYFPEIFKDPFDFETTNDLEGTWKTIAEEILNEHPEEREQKIAEFQKAFQNDPEVSKWRTPGETSRFEDRKHMIQYLRAGLWDVNTALHILRQYLASGHLYPGIVKASVPMLLEKVWSKKLLAATEYRDVYGRRIYIYRPGAWNPDDIPVNELFAGAYLMFEMMAWEMKTQIAGITMVCDLAGFGFKHLRNIGMEQVRCMTSFMSGAFPIWVRRIHVCNNPRLFGVLFNMMSPLMDERSKKNMVFHGNDFTLLHKEVPVFLLPKSLGGSGELNNDVSVKILMERNEYYEEMREHTLKHTSTKK